VPMKNTAGSWIKASRDVRTKANSPATLARAWSAGWDRCANSSGAEREPRREALEGGSHPPHEGAFMGEIDAFIGESCGSIQQGHGLFMRRFFVHGRPFFLPAIVLRARAAADND